MNARTRAALDDLAGALDLQSQLDPVATRRWRRALDGDGRPTLQLDDVSAIPFLVDIAGVELYQHRARVRAKSGDIFAAVTPAVDGYEEYCRALGFGEPELIICEPSGTSLQVARAVGAGRAYQRLVSRAREAGGMIVHPYMANEDVWELAEKLERDVGHVTVIGPPAPVTWIANDKQLFSEVAERTLGREWLVETQTQRDPAGLAAALRDLAGRHEQVGLKRTRCASAMGNAVFDAPGLRAEPAAETEAAVRAFLLRTEWDGNEDVLAVGWEQTDISPSTQMWIPPAELGPPRLDGVYEQILQGPEKVFVGSRPSTLGDDVNRRIGDAAVKVAESLQYLGYTGRCSFDHLVVDDRVLFTECNGRWGGTSTPMSMVDRLLRSPRPRPAYRAQDFIHEGLVGARFIDILDAARRSLFDPETRTGHFVFYNVGPLEQYGKLDVIAFGWSGQDEAEEALLETLPKLLGLCVS